MMSWVHEFLLSILEGYYSGLPVGNQWERDSRMWSLVTKGAVSTVHS